MADEQQPSEQTPSEPPAVKVARMRVEAFTDFLVVGAGLYMLKAGLVPDGLKEIVIVGILGIGGVGAFMKARGKSGSASIAIATAAPKAVAAAVAAVKGGGPMLLALALGTTLVLQACASVFAALPTIIAAAETASDVINAIADFVGQREHDHAIDVAITKTREALIAVRRAATGAKDVHDGDLQAALTEFQAAYQALLDLIGPLGVHAPPDDGRLAAPSPGELIVPNAPRLRLELEGGR